MPRILPEFDIKPVILPFDGRILQKQFNETAKALDERFDINKAEADKLALLSLQTQVNIGDQPIKDAAVQRIRDEINRIGEQDIGFENASQIISTLAQDFVGDEELRGARTSFANAQQQQELINQLRAQGKEPLFVTDPREFQTVTTDPETGERRIKPFQSTVEAPLDHFGDAKKFFGTLKADLESKGVSFTREGGIQFIKTGTEREIDEQDVLNRIDQVVDQFMESTTGGRQFVRKTAQELGVDENDPLVREQVEGLIFAAGADQTFKEEREQFRVDPFQVESFRASLRQKEIERQSSFRLRSTANVIPQAKANLEGIFTIRPNGEVAVGRGEEILALTEKGIDALPSTGGLDDFTVTGSFGPMQKGVLRTMARIREFFNDEGLPLEDLRKNVKGQRTADILLRTRAINENSSPEEVQDAMRRYGEDFFNSSVDVEANIITDNQGDPKIEFKGARINTEEFDEIMFKPDKDGIATKNGAISGLKVLPASPGDPKAGVTISGEELLERAREDDLILTTIGEVGNDNPYWPGARLIKDSEGRQYYIQGSAEEEIINNLEHLFHQVKWDMAQHFEFKDGKRPVTVIRDFQTGQIEVTYNKDGQPQLIRADDTRDAFNAYIQNR